MQVLTGLPIAAIPAVGEAGRTDVCVRVGPTAGWCFGVRFAVLNSTFDGTAVLARPAAAETGLTLELVKLDFPPEQRPAGHVCWLVMDLAAAGVRPSGTVLRTGAEKRVRRSGPRPTWPTLRRAAMRWPAWLTSTNTWGGRSQVAPSGRCGGVRPCRAAQRDRSVDRP